MISLELQQRLAKAKPGELVKVSKEEMEDIRRNPSAITVGRLLTTEDIIGENPMSTKKDPILIGIAGKAGSGKDTVADLLAERMKFGRHSFAKPIKDMLYVGLGLMDKADELAMELYGCTYRKLAQTLGTEWGRKLIDPDIWLAATKRATMGGQFIISDVRFNNEAEFIRKYGILIQLERPGQDVIEESDHSSEEGVDGFHGDYRIINFGDLEDLSVICTSVVVDLKEMLHRKHMWGP